MMRQRPVLGRRPIRPVLILVFLWIALATTRCETIYADDTSDDPIVMTTHTIPSRSLLANRETSVGDANNDGDDKIKLSLPRIEVQFLCEHDIRPDFNVTETFAVFFQEILNHHYNEGSSTEYTGGETTGGNNNNNLTQLREDDLELYSSISISDVHDVDHTYWFYPLCNESSHVILATMDVRGYVSLSEGLRHDDFLPSVDTRVLRSYFQDRVCKPLDFFRSKTVEWDEKTYPPPKNHQPIKEYQSVEHDSSSTHYNYHHFFDHNLYLLCGGAEDIMYQSNDDEDDDEIDGGFLVLGVIVGTVMLSMLWNELKPYVYDAAVSQPPRRQRNDGYATTVVQEVEMV